MTPPQDADGSRDRYENWVRRIENACMAACVGALAVMTLLMLVEVFLRYLLGAPLSWSTAFTADYLLAGLVFLGMAPTLRQDGHIRIDLVYTRLPARVRRYVDLFGNLLSLGFALLLCYAGIRITARSWGDGDIPPPGGADLSWPLWTSQIMVPLGAFVLALRLIQAVRKSAAGRSSTTLNDNPET